MEFKITTPTGDPSKILSALANGQVAQCELKKSGSTGTYSLSFIVDGIEYKGNWNGDEFAGSFKNKDPDDFRPGTRHFTLAVLFSSFLFSHFLLALIICYIINFIISLAVLVSIVFLISP